MNDEMAPGEEEFEALRRDIAALGTPDDIRPEDVGAKLPTAREMLDRAKAAEAATPYAAEQPESTRQSVWPRLLLVAAAAAAVVAGVLVVAPLGREAAVADTPPVLDFEFADARDIAWAPGKPARPTLLRLAKAAGQERTPVAAGTTQYVAAESWFAEIREGRKETSAVLIPTRRESWMHADGSFVVRESTGAPLRPDGRHDLRPPPPQIDTSVVEQHPAASLDPNAVTRLGLDPDAIRKVLLKDTDCPSNKRSAERASCLVGRITTLADNHVLPSATLRALWLMLAEEPALRDLGRVRDREAREGIGISLISPDYSQFRRVLIISPRTGRLLGIERILIRADPELDLRAPAIYEFRAIVAARMTDDPGPKATSN